MPKDPSELPYWNYDGSSTAQAPGTDSEVYLIPRRIFKDPFRKGNNILVMCDQYLPPDAVEGADCKNLKPIPTNTRAACAASMAKVMDQVRSAATRTFRTVAVTAHCFALHFVFAACLPCCAYPCSMSFCHSSCQGYAQCPAICAYVSQHLPLCAGALVWHRAGVHASGHQHQVAPRLARWRLPWTPGTLLLLCRRRLRDRSRPVRGALRALSHSTILP